jgi:hypothetical protein
LEAKDYLEKCIECFSLAAKSSSSPKAVESIEIQKSFYEKQLNLLNLKKALTDKCVDRIQKDDAFKIDINEQIENATNLQFDLLNNVSMADKAIEELMKNNPNLTELHQLNAQFNILLCKLFKFVDETVRENVTLKERKGDDESFKISPCVDNQANKAHETTVQEPTRALTDESEDDEEINDLPPLECPDFDLDK